MIYRELIEEPTTSDIDGVTENEFMYVKIYILNCIGYSTYYRANDPTNDNCPVYETPPDKYPAERIIKILLDPTIKESRICHQQPANITKSSTYVVNLNSLKDPEDVKKDNFGVWNHNGSHLQSFECCFSSTCRLGSFSRVWLTMGNIFCDVFIANIHQTITSDECCAS